MAKWTNGSMNEVVIEGILSETNLTTGTDKNGKDYIRGEIKIKVSQKVDGVEIDNEIPVRIYQTKLTKAGKVNPAYESAMKIKDEYVSIASCGREDKADWVSITTSGNITENAFYGRDGKLVSLPSLRASFVNKIKPNSVTPSSTFKVVFVVGEIKDEIKNDEPTGRIIIKGVIPQYGGRVDTIDFIVSNKIALERIQENWHKKDTVLAGGYINFTQKVSVTKDDSGFGEPLTEKHTTSVKELIISSGHESPLSEDEGAYSQEDIAEALVERKTRLADLENKTKQPAASTDFGF